MSQTKEGCPAADPSPKIHNRRYCDWVSSKMGCLGWDPAGAEGFSDPKEGDAGVASDTERIQMKSQVTTRSDQERHQVRNQKADYKHERD